MITYNEFVKNNLGRYLEYADPTNKNQCVDMMRYYIRDVWGLPPYSIPTALYVKDMYKKFISTSKLIKIPNTPTGVPKQGDLVFWGFYPGVTGWAGHVAVFDSGDTKWMTTFGQNYPTGRPCGFWKYWYYRGVMGWIHKK